MNGLQSISEWKDYFGKPTGSVLGVVNAAQSIGSVLSLPFVGIMSDRIGRRLTLLSGAIVIVIALIIQAASVNYGMFVFARVLVGVGSMLVVQPSPMLITELAYPTHRGKYTSAFWTMYYLGAILESWASFGTQKHLSFSDWSWRVPSIIQAGFSLVQNTNNVRAAAYQANVTNQSEIEAVIQQIAKDFGKLDILVANSGIASCVAAEDYIPDQWSDIMKVNLDGAFYSAQAAESHLQGTGSWKCDIHRICERDISERATETGSSEQV
jgi:MFS family permease